MSKPVIFVALLATLLGASAGFAASPGLDSTDPLVAVDRNRQSIIADIAGSFGDPAGLKERLSKLRADHLLAASLASSRATLDAILEESESTTRAVSSRAREKVFGDANRDLVYVPLTPCRLIDTRGFGAPIQGGAFFPNARRAYAPAGLCAIPTSGVASLLISFTTQNMTPNSGGYLAILAPGAPVTASVDVFNLGAEWSASNTAVATGPAGQFDVLVAVATANVVIDILGYFAPPPNGSVVTAQLADLAVTSAKMADQSVTSAKIVDASVTSTKIADASVTTAKLANGSITAAKLAPGIATPSGFMLLGTGTTPPPGYTYSGPAFESWTARPSMPTARYLHGVAALNGSIYVIGGFPTTNVNESFDLGRGQWSTLAPMTTARYSVVAAAANGRIYVIGGVGGGPAVGTNEEYDPASNTWAPRAAMPTARSDACVAVVAGNVYVIGGRTGPVGLSANERYDPVSNTWLARAAMPTARSFCSAAVLNGKIYVAGGVDSGNSVAVLEEYDPATNTWTTKTPMPTARCCAGGAAADGRLYVFGGSPPSGGYTGANEEYDPIANAWATRRSLDLPRRTSGVVVNGRIFAAAGSDNNPSAQLDEYQLSPYSVFVKQ